MKRQDFYFDLPAELIAQYPLAARTASKLLCYNRKNQHVAHQQFDNLLDHLTPGDLLVFNDTKVIPARLFGHKTSGGKIEILVERIVEMTRAWCHIRASKSPKPGAVIIINDHHITVVSRQDDLFLCDFASDVLQFLEGAGHLPLPLYIERAVESEDLQRYQTVFAKHLGAVAAPTAGLHFDDILMQNLQHKGIDCAYVTLHVGAGTFQPVRVDEIINHAMHYEYLKVSAQLCEQIKNTKQRGNRVIAVGTTVVRSLEAAAREGELLPFDGETNIFIYPEYSFKVIDGIITNFHLPESTLLMLVAAFVGRQKILELYQTAIEQRYRFYSYGDAMLLL